MKTKLLAVVAVLGAAFVSSCASGPEPIGVIYTDVATPQAATTGVASKSGSSQAVSYFGIIATGDASIEAAKKNGGIKTVSAVDRKRSSILGIYSEYTTTVSGQ